MALSADKKQLLFDGAFIPAHPLALNSDKSLDEESQRRLTQYYIEAGVDGLAVGVHTTQFEIRDPKFNLYEKVLRLAIEEVESHTINRSFLMIAGVCGPTDQSVEEAKLAKRLGYDMVLVSNGGLGELLGGRFTRADSQNCRGHSCIRFLSTACGRRKETKL